MPREKSPSRTKRLDTNQLSLLGEFETGGLAAEAGWLRKNRHTYDCGRIIPLDDESQAKMM
jgi:hypothetical protein